VIFIKLFINLRFQRKGKFPDKGLSVVETGAKVLDFEFNPFNEKMLVTAGEKCCS
jgi:hypothetical protein